MPNADNANVRQCPGCQYLVPPAWERCKRCDADLSGARVPVPVGAAAHAASPPATFGAARVHRAAPPVAAPPRPPAFSPLAGTRVETVSSVVPSAIAPTAPLDVRSYERVPTAGEAWHAPAHGRNPKRFPIVGLIVTFAIVGSCWYAWTSATRREVPADLRGYVNDRDGIDYAPEFAGFRVLLPKEPAAQVVAQTVRVAGGTMTINGAASVGDQHALGVAWFDVPPVAIESRDMDANLRQLAEGYAAANGDVVRELDFVQAEGYPAIDATVAQGEITGKVRVILTGRRAFILFAASDGYGPAGFSTLIDSFSLA
jgi:hypothetical protein